MFPFRYSSTFKSRWVALLWAAGILWMAMDVAEKPADHDSATAPHSTATPASNAQQSQAEAILKKLGG